MSFVQEMIPQASNWLHVIPSCEMLVKNLVCLPLQVFTTPPIQRSKITLAHGIGAGIHRFLEIMRFQGLGDVVGDARSGRTFDVLPVLLGRVFSLFLLLNLTGLSSRIASRYVAIKLFAFIGKTAPAISNHLGETVFEWQSKKNTK